MAQLLQRPHVLAHRGNGNGPDPGTENTVTAVRRALDHGWGVELDIRRTANGLYYMSHDPQPSTDGCASNDVLRLLRLHPEATAAINIKELGYEADLLRYLDAEGVLHQSFLFDMELLESRAGETARVMQRLCPAARLAARVSDRGEPVAQALANMAATVVWLDEFDDQWCTADDVQRLKNAGFSVYAVSPDLQGYDLDVAVRRWADFLAWGVDGICTDYPAALTARIAAGPGPVEPAARVASVPAVAAEAARAIDVADGSAPTNLAPGLGALLSPLTAPVAA